MFGKVWHVAPLHYILKLTTKKFHMLKSHIYVDVNARLIYNRGWSVLNAIYLRYSRSEEIRYMWS